METPLLSTPLDYDLCEVVKGIFENMLQLPVTAECGPSQAADDCCTAIVNFKGSWVGLVALYCETDEARRLARRFLALSEDELPDQLVADVIGEIVNMIAGNLKSVFANDLRLSIAQVTHGASNIILPFQPVIRHEACFESIEGRFQVAIFAIPSEPRRPWPERPAIPVNSCDDRDQRG
jgi:chemotaxis protein CheX